MLWSCFFKKKKKNNMWLFLFLPLILLLFHKRFCLVRRWDLAIFRGHFQFLFYIKSMTERKHFKTTITLPAFFYQNQHPNVLQKGVTNIPTCACVTFVFFWLMCPLLLPATTFSLFLWGPFREDLWKVETLVNYSVSNLIPVLIKLVHPKI